jgi:hypothetical protein
MGLLAERKGKFEEAIGDFVRFIQLQPAAKPALSPGALLPSADEMNRRSQPTNGSVDLSRFRRGPTGSKLSVGNPGAQLTLALLGGHGKERGHFLFNVLAAARRALWLLLVVFVQGQHRFERLVTIKADIIIDGHGKPPVKYIKGIVRLCPPAWARVHERGVPRFSLFFARKWAFRPPEG